MHRIRSTLPTAIVGIVLLAGCSSEPRWTKTYGGPESELGAGIVPAQAGGYYIFGTRDLRFNGQQLASITPPSSLRR